MATIMIKHLYYSLHVEAYYSVQKDCSIFYGKHLIENKHHV